MIQGGVPLVCTHYKITNGRIFVLNQTGVRVILSVELFYTKGEASKLAEFINYFLTIDGMSGKILLEHKFFDKKAYRCECFKIVNTDDKIGLHYKGHDMCVSKNNIKLSKVYENVFILADEYLQLTITVNKL